MDKGVPIVEVVVYYRAYARGKGVGSVCRQSSRKLPNLASE